MVTMGSSFAGWWRRCPAFRRARIFGRAGASPVGRRGRTSTRNTDFTHYLLTERCELRNSKRDAAESIGFLLSDLVVDVDEALRQCFQCSATPIPSDPRDRA